MSLSAGARLGPYEILGPLGAGGMGEVYRARDVRIGREVAIKLSGERFTGRLEREVRAVAALNHPNVCHLYDVGPNYLVMELIDGPTLAERLERGAMPVEEALAIARQVVEALEAAHEKGIVHRDLKPANIKIKPDGTVKVLDFGLAKMTDAVAASPSESLTMPMGVTVVGQIVGTAAYMAPEQARGKAVDNRTDIWAFGVILYEMLTGRRLFEGETASDVLAGVLTKDPDLGALPPHVRYIVERCLRKDPRKRWQEVGDVGMVLQQPPPDRAMTVPPPVARHTRWAWVIAAASLLVALIASFEAVRLTKTVAALRGVPLIRLDADLGADAQKGAPYAPSMVAISPDGRRIVYPVRGPNGFQMLAFRLLEQPAPTPIIGTEGGSGAFFSPDSQWIGFFSDGKLKKIALAGGTAVTLADASNPRGGSWSDDGTIVAALTNTAGLHRLPASGGSAPQPLTQLGPGEVTHRWPQILPGGTAVLFTSSKNISDYESATIEAVGLKTAKRKIIHEGGYFGRFAASGHLLFMHNGTLFGGLLDLAALNLRGQPALVLSDIAASAASGAGQYDLSNTGVLVYKSGKPEPESWLIAELDPNGARRHYLQMSRPASYFTPRFSPDNTRLAVGMEAKGLDIFVYDLRRDSLSRLTFLSHNAMNPVWSPDSRHIAFQAVGGETHALMWIRSDGAGEPQVLVEGKSVLEPHAISPDGKRLVYQQRAKAYFEIWTLPLDLADPNHPEPGAPERFAAAEANLIHPAVSPDGRWMAYASDESGSYQVYVRPFQSKDAGGKWQVSLSGGRMPVWSCDRNSLFFTSLDNRIMVARYTATGSTFQSDKPTICFEQELAASADYRNFDLRPDGKGVVALLPVHDDRKGSLHATFLLNFADELRRKVR